MHKCTLHTYKCTNTKVQKIEIDTSHAWQLNATSVISTCSVNKCNAMTDSMVFRMKEVTDDSLFQITSSDGILKSEHLNNRLLPRVSHISLLDRGRHFPYSRDFVISLVSGHQTCWSRLAIWNWWILILVAATFGLFHHLPPIFDYIHLVGMKYYRWQIYWNRHCYKIK